MSGIRVEVHTQAELDLCIKDGNIAVCVAGTLVLVLTGAEAPHIAVTGSASISIVARGSSAPSIVAWGSSAAYMDARAFARALIRGSVMVNAWPTATVVCQGKTGWHVDGVEPKVIDISSARAWCDYYGVEVVDGIATVYKALDGDFHSRGNTYYTPGTAPSAPDWDGGAKECGGGLHFSPHPKIALNFKSNATRFVACGVALADMRAPHGNDEYPEKIKARRVTRPCVEVTRDGDPMDRA